MAQTDPFAKLPTLGILPGLQAERSTTCRGDNLGVGHFGLKVSVLAASPSSLALRGTRQPEPLFAAGAGQFLMTKMKWLFLSLKTPMKEKVPEEGKACHWLVLHKVSRSSRPGSKVKLTTQEGTADTILIATGASWFDGKMSIRA